MGWLWAEAQRPPPAHRGVSGLPWRPLESAASPAVDGTGTVLLGRPALSRMAVRMAVRQAGPQCLTISLAPVGIFLETRRSRAGDRRQGGWMGREDGKRGRQAGQAVGELGEWGSHVLGAWGLVKGCCWPRVKPYLGNAPNPLPGFAPPSQVGPSGYQPPSTLGTREGKGPCLGQLPALLDLQAGAGQKLGWALQLCPAGVWGWSVEVRNGACSETLGPFLCVRSLKVGSGERWVGQGGFGGGPGALRSFGIQDTLLAHEGVAMRTRSMVL